MLKPAVMMVDREVHFYCLCIKIILQKCNWYHRCNCKKSFFLIWAGFDQKGRSGIFGAIFLLVTHITDFRRRSSCEQPLQKTFEILRCVTRKMFKVFYKMCLIEKVIIIANFR